MLLDVPIEYALNTMKLCRPWCFSFWAGIVQSVHLPTGWTVRGLNSERGEIFLTRPERSWDPPKLLYNGYRVISGDRTVGAWLNHPYSLPAPRVKSIVMPLLPLLAFMACFGSEFTLC